MIYGSWPMSPIKYVTGWPMSPIKYVTGMKVSRMEDYILLYTYKNIDIQTQRKHRYI